MYPFNDTYDLEEYDLLELNFVDALYCDDCGIVMTTADYKTAKKYREMHCIICGGLERGENMTYKIVRFFADAQKPSVVKHRGLTLDEARQHCSNPNIRKEGEFDGYTEE